MNQTSHPPGPSIELLLTGTIFHQLIVASNLISKPFMEEFARPHALTLSEWRVLMALGTRPGSSGEDVAREMGMERMTVSRSLRSLEADGRVARESDASHPKRLSWTLTSAGARLVATLGADALARQERVLSTLSGPEREQLSALLQRLLGGLREEHGAR